MAKTYAGRGATYSGSRRMVKERLHQVLGYMFDLAHSLRAELVTISSSSAHRAQKARAARNWIQRAVPWPPIVEIGLIMLWIHVLTWGESSAFRAHVSDCDWSSWESWPATASPYRLALVADPQLVDPHTYPGRPWPLSTFTVRHTDQYLRRSFESMLDTLDPSSVLFLGDLFDGGREWSTDHGNKSPEKRWNKYGEDFWLNEYERFARIFVDPWAKASQRADPSIERRFRANLPGNHDLGISNGVQLGIRDRFSTYFGEGNLMEVLGNHTVVMVDTVSLTAKTAQSDGNPDNRAIWEPADTFLQQAQDRRKIVAEREVRARKGVRVNEPMEHTALAHPNMGGQTRPSADLEDVADFPALLLTHVPLYRLPGTPCGPLRERHPPSRTESGEPLESDEPNAIKVHSGYQYQNVLHPEITEQLITSVGESTIAHVFSGDDHDYCEVLHKGYSALGAGIREITVKSMSWAMGVRRPGFLLVSLWNPIDSKGHSITSETTIQTQLCLLPDQLGIFIYYGKIMGLTILVLVTASVISAARGTVSGRSTRESGALLPLVNAKQSDKDDEPFAEFEDHGSCSSSSHSADGGLSSRARKGNPSIGSVEKDWERSSYAFPGAKSHTVLVETRPPNRRHVFFRRFWISIRMVGICALGYYVYLARTV